MSTQLPSSLPYVSGFTGLGNVRVVFAEGRTLYQGPATAFQASDDTLTALAGLDSSAGVVYQSGADTFDKIAIADIPWLAQPLGTPIPIMTDITGFGAPPTDNSLYRFIELTAGLTGGGGYNEGCLTSESVSGSAPLVVATAVIDLASSPAYGQTIHLINTEQDFLRASDTPGTVQQDAMQGHRQARYSSAATFVTFDEAGGGNALGAGSSGIFRTVTTTGDPITDGVNGTPRTASETRAKNLGVKYFVRIF